MSSSSLRGLPVSMSAIGGCLLSLSSALAQGGGVVNPSQIAMPLTVTPSKTIEADGTTPVSLEIRFAFANQSAANTWDGQHPLTIGYTTQNGTATGGTCGTAGADFVATTGAVQFSGQLSETRIIQVCGDDLSEGDEQFGLRFTSTENHANFFITFPNGNPATVTITDDEPLPSLSITPTVQVAEPASGQTSAEFIVSLTGPINQRPVTVDFNTSPGTAAAGTTCPRSSENVDYLTKAGTLTFSAPGNLLQSPQIPRTQRIAVAVCSDNRRFEERETFFVDLARPVNAKLTASGTAFGPVTSPKLNVTRGTATIN